MHFNRVNCMVYKFYYNKNNEDKIKYKQAGRINHHQTTTTRSVKGRRKLYQTEI